MAVKKSNIRQEVQAVGFYIGEDEYAIYIHKVREIYPMTEIRKIPKAPQFVEGVINLRGQIIPVIDLRKRFDMAPNESRQTAKILIVELEKNQVGMIVDNVSEVMRFYVDEIEKAPAMFSASIDSQYIQGVAKLDNKLIILLDLEKLLSFEEKSVLKSFS
ncbi:MAG TPA: chemotaxis protein CheW [Candidatus Rifleibacterium sp.]|jgi:purine-binding chemotaxis protein CheW|nr:chemotaxis protein CheW [Candidatus Rifleibacterium sp.]HOI90859.1 chemotaxis protein CheW [Candidatus Rifleibacterium sp.]HPW57993.1 chemotaxis protein CheW [Candidatus Rifleibacterium sp.]